MEDIRSRLEGRFAPFKLRTSDGMEFSVPHREFVLLSPRRVAIDDGNGHVDVLDPFHIVSIEEAGTLPTP
jgi:hypothetical protein